MRAKIKPMTYAIKKLARRSYSVYEMKEAIINAGYEMCEVEEVISQLINKGYLNDRKYAQKMYEHYTQQKPCGPLLLAIKLKSKGIHGEIIDELITDYSVEKELEIIKIVSAKLLHKNRETKQELLFRQLQRKGFTCSSIIKYIRLYWTEF
jgi:regulatory protein